MVESKVKGLRRLYVAAALLSGLSWGGDLAARPAPPPALDAAGCHRVRLVARGEHASTLRVERTRDGRCVWSQPCAHASNITLRWAPRRELLLVYEILDGRARGVDDRVRVWSPRGCHTWTRTGMVADALMDVAWSPDERRVLLRLAPGFGHLDVDLGTLFGLDLATGQVRQLATSVRRARWTSGRSVHVWEVRDVRGSDMDAWPVTQRELAWP